MNTGKKKGAEKGGESERFGARSSFLYFACRTGHTGAQRVMVEHGLVPDPSSAFPGSMLERRGLRSSVPPRFQNLIFLPLLISNATQATISHTYLHLLFTFTNFKLILILKHKCK